MLNLQPVTHIFNSGDGLASEVLYANWQGVNAMKAAALGNVPDNSAIVRIPLDILGDVKIKKNDLLALGAVEIAAGATAKQICMAHEGNIIRVRSVRVCGGLSDRVNHLEVVGS